MRASVSMTNLPKLISTYRNELDQAIDSVVERGIYIGGPEVELFEKEWSDYVGVQHTVGVGNGTDALVLSLLSIGIRSGDKIATVSLTAGATAVAIKLIGAIPVWTDIDPATLTMSVESLQQVLELNFNTSRPVKAIIPVHLYGNPADMTGIMDLARAFKCIVIEDCAQAHGAHIGSRLCGTFGQIAAFSFYPTKNLGCLGDGGAVCTNDKTLAEKARVIAQYGWKERNNSEIKGFNSRLDALQAAILRVRLRHLSDENMIRRNIALKYIDSFGLLPLQLSSEKAGHVNVFHQFVIRVEDRDSVEKYLSGNGIESQIHYPRPLHSQKAFLAKRSIRSIELPSTEEACQKVLSIPVHPALTESDTDYIIQCINTFFK
jgi:dTDP-4-amino-4,6-dideoxygalactose transaminase